MMNHDEMVNTLARFSTLGLHLDDRLEAVVSRVYEALISSNTLLLSLFSSQYESFVLQLTYNPLRLPVLRVFDIDRRMIIISLNSVVLHTLVMIEYDIKNFRTIR